MPHPKQVDARELIQLENPGAGGAADDVVGAGDAAGGAQAAAIPALQRRRGSSVAGSERSFFSNSSMVSYTHFGEDEEKTPSQIASALIKRCRKEIKGVEVATLEEHFVKLKLHMKDALDKVAIKRIIFGLCPECKIHGDEIIIPWGSLRAEQVRNFNERAYEKAKEEILQAQKKYGIARNALLAAQQELEDQLPALQKEEREQARQRGEDARDQAIQQAIYRNKAASQRGEAIKIAEKARQRDEEAKQGTVEKSSSSAFFREQLAARRTTVKAVDRAGNLTCFER